jgi:archaetidylinositol phosphate synthase
MMERGEFFRSWSSLHGGAEVKGIVKWWLNLAYSISRALGKARISANALTYCGVFIAFALFFSVSFGRAESTPYLVLGLALLLLSLIADGVDGSLALLTSSTSRYGAALDSIADRLVEFLWAMVFLSLGADLRLVLVAYLLAQIQEYIRARLGGLGIHEVGIVTVCERPVRAIFLAVALITAILVSVMDLETFISLSIEDLISFVVAIWLIFQLIAVVMLSRWAMKVVRS